MRPKNSNKQPNKTPLQMQSEQLQETEALRKRVELGQQAHSIRLLLNSFSQNYQDDLLKQLKAPNVTTEQINLIRGQLLGLDLFMAHLLSLTNQADAAMDRLQKQVK